MLYAREHEGGFMTLFTDSLPIFPCGEKACVDGIDRQGRWSVKNE
jgi:hypothetical protein